MWQCCWKNYQYISLESHLSSNRIYNVWKENISRFNIYRKVARHKRYSISICWMNEWIHEQTDKPECQTLWIYTFLMWKTINKDGSNNFPPFPYTCHFVMWFCHSSHQEAKFIPPSLESGLRQVTCFGQWGKSHAKRLENHLCFWACPLLREFFCYYMKKLGLTHWRMSPHGTEIVCPSWGPKPTSLQMTCWL